MNNQYFSARRITWFAILLALVVVLQIWGSAIPVGATRLCFTLVPIVLGAILLGPIAGMILGVAFGFVVLITALIGGDAFTLFLLQDAPVMTVIIIFGKGALAGFIPGLCYKALRKRPVIATFVASALAPIMNTGFFICGALIINGTISSLLGGANTNEVVYFVIITCAGINFLVELGLNLIVSPALIRIIKIVGNKVDFIPENIEKEQVDEVEVSQESLDDNEGGEDNATRD